MTRRVTSITVALLLVLSILSILNVMGQSVSSGLTIDSVTVSPEPRWIGPAPIEPRITVVVHNDASIPSASYSLEYRWVSSGGDQWLQGTQESSTDLGEPLAPGAYSDDPPHWIDWELDQSHRGSGSLQILLLQGTEVVDTYIEEFYIPVRSLGLQFPDPDPVTVYGGETGFLRLNVSNLGNMVEDIALSLTPTDTADPDYQRLEEWIEPPHLTVAPGETATTTLFFRYEFTGDLSDFSVQYTIDAVTHDGLGQEIGGRSVTPNIGINNSDSGNTYGFILTTVQSGPVFVAPGSDATASFRLWNTGSREDVYELLPSSAGTWAVTGTTLNQKDVGHIALDAGQRADITVRMHAPEDAHPGSDVDARVSVQSQALSDSPDGIKSRSQTIQVDGPRIAFTDISDVGVTYIDESPHIRFYAINSGNRLTPDQTPLDITVLYPDGTVSKKAPAIPSVVPQGMRKVDIDLDPTSTGGDTDITITLAASQTTGPAASATHAVRIHSPQTEMTVADPLSGSPGEVVSYRAAPHVFTLRNTGSDPETFLVRATASNGSVALDSDGIFTLAPDASRSIPLTHQLPLPSLDLKEALLEIHVEVKDRPRFNWTANTTTQVNDIKAPTIEMADLPPLWSELNPSYPVSAEVHDDSQVSWVKAYLQAAEEDPVAFNLTLVDGEWTRDLPLSGPGKYTAWITARDHWGNEANTTGHVFDVRPIEPPTVTIQLAPDSIVWRDTPVCVRAVDGLEVKEVRAGLNGTADTTLAKQGDCYLLPTGDLPLGTADLYVEAVNEANRVGSTSLTVTVQAPPELKLNEENPSPGTPLALVFLVVALLVRSRRHP